MFDALIGARQHADFWLLVLGATGPDKPHRCRTSSGTAGQPAMLSGSAFAGPLGIHQQAPLRESFPWRQARIMAVSCRAVGTENCLLAAHVDVDVRMVMRRRRADTFEFRRPGANLPGPLVIAELWIAASDPGHSSTAPRYPACRGSGILNLLAGRRPSWRQWLQPAAVPSSGVRRIRVPPPTSPD